MLLPPTPHILGRDLPIRQHKSQYMLAPPRLVGSWVYALLNDQARGPVLDQAPFQASGYVPGSPTDQANPFRGPIAGDYADDSITWRFIDDTVRDDDSPQANHVLLYHDDVAHTWACFSHFSCILQSQTWIYQTASWQAQIVCIILPLGRLQTCMYYIAPQCAQMNDIASQQASDVCMDIASWQALHVCFQILPLGRLLMYV